MSRFDDSPKSSESAQGRSGRSAFSRASSVHDRADTSHPLSFWVGAILAGVFSAAVWAVILYALVRLFW
ncbi:hypothetical protein [Marinicauda sp. Alg238-R41]|uniref:hypothetical protein n=1 Tax=Marinicauda sp. Alg238-R41 TaxID=2993447 RepID=UPI0022E41E69|nr:hypothetical protein [Marinicauda sp. Alg238-R41]